MCTFNWIREDRGYFCLFNRDESNMRPKALWPEWKEASNSVRYLSPTDPQGGGTWAGLNEYGLGSVLLNWYIPSQNEKLEQGTVLSRGRIIPGIMSARNIAEAEHEIMTGTVSNELQYFPPFQLVVLDISQNNLRFQWNGKKIVKTSNITFPVCSSGFEPEKIIPWRQELFQSMSGQWAEEGLPLTRNRLLDYHIYGKTNPDGYTPLMRRPEASTRSLTAFASYLDPHEDGEKVKGEFFYLDDPLNYPGAIDFSSFSYYSY